MSDKPIEVNCQTIYTENNYRFKWIIDKQCIEELLLTAQLSSTAINVSDHSLNANNWCLILSNEQREREVFESKSNKIIRTNDVVIYLMLTNGKDVSIRYKVSIIDVRGKKRKFFGQYVYKNRGEVAQVYYIQKEELMNDTNGLFVDNKLIILCELKEIGQQNSTSVQTHSPKLLSTEYQVINDLSALFESGKGSDVVLVTNKSEFNAHKAILMARSVVFSAMFGHTMEEKITNRVVIQDIDSEVIHAMLAFIYTGRVANLKELGADLLAAADKYGLDELKTICEDSLFTNITVENAIQVLLLSDSLKAYKLKSHSIDFITKHAKEVMKTEDWNRLPASYPNLIAEIIASMTQNLSII